MALLLKKKGITKVRPLEGGLEAWRELGFPIDELVIAPETVQITGA